MFIIPNYNKYYAKLYLHYIYTLSNFTINCEKKLSTMNNFRKALGPSPACVIASLFAISPVINDRKQKDANHNLGLETGKHKLYDIYHSNIVQHVFTWLWFSSDGHFSKYLNAKKYKSESFITTLMIKPKNLKLWIKLWILSVRQSHLANPVEETPNNSFFIVPRFLTQQQQHPIKLFTIISQIYKYNLPNNNPLSLSLLFIHSFIHSHHGFIICLLLI